MYIIFLLKLDITYMDKTMKNVTLSLKLVMHVVTHCLCAEK